MFLQELRVDKMGSSISNSPVNQLVAERCSRSVLHVGPLREAQLKHIPQATPPRFALGSEGTAAIFDCQ